MDFSDSPVEAMAEDRHSVTPFLPLYKVVGNLPHTMSSARLKCWSEIPVEASDVFGKVARGKRDVMATSSFHWLKPVTLA